MFNLFRKKTKIDVLQKKYQKLLKEAHALSTVNRMQSDQKTAEAHKILQEIEALTKADN